jgi:hypothetical protein
MAEVYSREVHGIPFWLMKEYLVELGGQAVGEGLVIGNGWDAEFARIENFKIGSISIGRLSLKIKGDSTALAILLPQLELKLLRGGG